MANSLLFSLLMKMDAGQAKAELAALTTATTKMGKEFGDLPAKTRPAKDAVGDLGNAYASAGEASDKSAKLIAAAALAASRADLLRLKSTDGATKEDIAAAQAAYNKANALDAAASAALAADRANMQMAGAATNLGRANQQAAGSVGNLLAQFNDIAVMIAAGQNPLQLAIQQGSQINQVIGPMGAAGAVKALGGALLGMLNPLNFITLAVIAGGAAFAQWIMSGEEAAATLEEAMDGLGESIDKYTGYIRTAATDTSELTEQFGRFAGQIKGFSEYLAGIALGQSMDELRATLVPLEGTLGGFEQSLKNVEMAQRAVASEQALLNQGFGNPEAVLRAQEALEMFRAKAESTAGQLGLTTDQAADFARLLDALGDANSMEDIATAAGNALRYLEQTTPAGEDLSGAMAAAAFALGEMQAKAAEALKETVALSNSAPATGWMSAAIGETNLLIAKLKEASALSRLADWSGNNYQRVVESGGVDAIARSGNAKAFGRAIPKVIGVGNPNYKEPRGGGGAGAAQKEADSVAKLIEKLQDELDITRELDPVQQEMARYRDQLAKATDGEREKVEALIATRIREKAAMESLSYVGEQSGNALIDGLMGAADAGEQLIDTLMRAALQAVILGKGPLANILGGGGGLMGGLFSGLGGGAQGGVFDLFGGGALIGGLADGGGVGDGMIYGAGGPRDDLVPFWGSAGEFVVNARATHRHRALLEQINSGQLDSAPAFANGGAIGGGAGVAGGGGLGGGTVFNAHFDLRGAQGDDAVQAAAKRGMDAALREFARSELPSQVRRISADPSVTRF